MPSSVPESWSTAQRRLHWLVALGVVCTFGLSLVMENIGDDQGLLKFFLYQIHKTLGLLVLLGVVARLVLLVRRGRPPLAPELTEANRRLAVLGHVLLYGLLIAVPILGYLTNSTSPSRIPVLFLLVVPVPNLTPPSQAWFDFLVGLHYYGGIALILTAAAHALVAIMHHRRGLPVLRDMWGH